MQPLSSAPTPSGNESSKPSNALAKTTSQKLGKDGFLKILVTQLKNQNPSNPLKGRNLASQLAQFSSVEQLTNISDQLKNQKSSSRSLTQSVNSGVATDLIGKNVEARGGTFQWSGQGKATIGVDLQSPASELTVTIRNAAGNAINTRTIENVQAGKTELTWDGETEAGAEVPDGKYSVDVKATGAQGSSVSATPYLAGQVDRVAFSKDGTQLSIGGAKIPMSRVESVTAP